MNLKPLLLTAALAVGLNSLAKAQDASVEKSIYGVQTGLLGIWAQNEFRITDKFAFRSELGFDASLYSAFRANRRFDYTLAPTLTVEPRWYYNIKRRETKGRRTANNSANYLTVKLKYYPDLFVISNSEHSFRRRVDNTVAIIPTWGIRRVLGKHFTYEFGVGYGYRYAFWHSHRYSNYSGQYDLNIDFRLGYTF